MKVWYWQGRKEEDYIERLKIYISRTRWHLEFKVGFEKEKKNKRFKHTNMIESQNHRQIIDYPAIRLLPTQVTQLGKTA